jgi:hypothetical protein
VQDLLDEQGGALRPSNDPGEYVGGHLGAQNVLHQGRPRPLRNRPQVQAEVVVLGAQKPRGDLEELRPTEQKHEDWAASKSVKEEFQQIEAGVIRPMDILKHQEHGHALRHAAQEFNQHGEHPATEGISAGLRRAQPEEQGERVDRLSARVRLRTQHESHELAQFAERRILVLSRQDARGRADHAGPEGKRRPRGVLVGASGQREHVVGEPLDVAA